MMIVNGKEFNALVDKILKPHGFIKKKDTWYLHTEECVVFFVLSKSPYGGKFEHIMGVFLNELHMELEQYPKYHKADQRIGLDEFADRDAIRKAFDLEYNEFKGNEREAILTDLLENYAVPFMKEISTRDGILEAIKKYKPLYNRSKGHLLQNLQLL